VTLVLSIVKMCIMRN